MNVSRTSSLCTRYCHRCLACLACLDLPLCVGGGGKGYEMFSI